MKNNLVASLLAPCHLSMLPRLEQLAEQRIIGRLALNEDEKTAVRAGASEGGRIVLTTPAKAVTNPVVAFCALGDPAFPCELSLKFDFPASGLSVNGFRPPYPPYLVGLSFYLVSVLGLKLFCRVESRESVLILLKDHEVSTHHVPVDSACAEEIQRLALPLLALCRCWSTVRFRRNETLGCSLVLEHPASPAILAEEAAEYGGK